MPLLLISILLLLLAASIPRYFIPVHAGGFPGGPGIVCLIDPSTAPSPPANPCPPTPYVFTGPFPSTPQVAPTQIRIGVYINGSSALNGFDITLKSNNTAVLLPASFDASKTLLPSPYILQGCVNGILVSGNTCAGTDTYGTIHVYGVAGLGLITSPPTTGFLFTSIWNIVGNSTLSGTGVSFQTGCSNTSVGPNVCVTISNGTTNPDVETLQTGNTFVNPAPVTVPWVALTSTPNATTLSVLKGTAVSIAISAVAENGWPSFATDLVNFTSTITSGFQAPTLSVTSCSTGGAECGATATLNTGATGPYVVYFFGTYVTVDPNTLLSDTLVGSIRFNVNVQDVALSVSPVGNLYMFGNLPLTVTVQSFGGYAGTVTLSTGSLSPTTGLTISYPTPFSLGVNSITTKTVNITSTSFNKYLYQMKMSIAGVGCVPACEAPTITHNSPIITFYVSGFSLTSNATTIFTTGSSHALAITVRSLGNSVPNSFAGAIALSSTSTPSGLTVSFNVTSVTLAVGGIKGVLVSFSSSTPGTYTARIVGSGGTNSLMTNQTVSLTIGISSIAFQVTMTFKGANATLTGNLRINSASRTLAGSTFLTVVNGTTGGPIFSKNANVTMTFNMFGKSHFIEEIPTSPLWLATSCEMDVNSGLANCFLSRTPDINHDGFITIADVGYIVPRYGGGDPLANLSGSGTVSISDFGIIVLYYGAAVFLP